MTKIGLLISFFMLCMVGCSESRPPTVSVAGSMDITAFDPEQFPEEAPDIEPEGGYSSLAALIESRNATPSRIQELLELGADVMERGNRGWTPLHWAASNSRDPKVISTLLESGADVNAKAKGFTPLHCAAMVNPNPQIIMVLLEAGAELNVRLDTGENPLYLACSSAQKNPGIIMVLLAAGADANAKNFIDQTPLDFARKNQSLQGTEALKSLESATGFLNRAF